MVKKLIIIRGNSGCGKSTTAKILQEKLGYGTMLIPQDVVRREIVRTKDGIGNHSIDLIRRITEYGWEIGYTVIIEGILVKKGYHKMLKDLINRSDQAFIYYFDIPFEETLKRHNQKPNKDEWGEKEMRQWWCEKDILGFKNEKLITKNMSQNQVISMVLNDINRNNED